MKTLSITEARANLGKLCENAKQGEEIGIIAGNTILQLIPVQIRPIHKGEVVITPMTLEHIRNEYGVSASEWNEFKQREETSYKEAKRKGKIVTFKGKFNPSKLD